MISSLAPRGTITFHNYVGNHGNTTLGRKTPFGVRTNGQPNKYGRAPFISVSSSTSVPQVMKLSDITDGLSSTMAFSETVKGQFGDLRGFGWWQGGSHYEAYLTPNSNQPDVTEQDPYCVNQRPNMPCTGPTTANPEGNRRPQPASGRRQRHDVRRRGEVHYRQREPGYLAIYQHRVGREPANNLQ